ncbi:radical SAM protein [Fodinicurvata sp. EGI_FJ10296]|uniref:radical SAM protein n=1 Tax=Fodinicurvata sp. EGI_FJ10296 TaxID=3231908 RepID=UPI003455521D
MTSEFEAASTGSSATALASPPPLVRGPDLGPDLADDIQASLAGAYILDDRLQWVEALAALGGVRGREAWYRLAGMKPDGVNPRPLAAQIEFTQRCNLTCSFCYNDSGPDNRDELSMDCLASVCQQLIDLQVAELIISGGEPLMRPAHLGLVLDIFSGSGIPIHVLTNGTLMTDAWCRRLKDAGAVTLQVSLDGGDPAVHDVVRGRRGSWAKALGGLAMAADHGLHTFVSTVLTRDNVASLPALVDACYLAGCRTLNIGDLITWGRGDPFMASGACTDDQYDDAAEFIRARGLALQDHMDIRLAVSMYFYICQLRYRGQESMLIRGDGSVRPHCTLSGIVCGSVHEESLAEIWDRRLAAVHRSAELDAVLAAHQLVVTPRLRQIRCARRSS